MNRINEFFQQEKVMTQKILTERDFDINQENIDNNINENNNDNKNDINENNKEEEENNIKNEDIKK